MVTVARVTEPSVNPTALPGARLNANLSPNYNDGIARGMGQLGGVVEQIQQKEQAKVDTAQVLEARRKLSDWERAQFDPANPEGVYSKKGRNALELEDKISPDFDTITSELMGNIRSPKARETFQAMAQSQRESVLGRVQSYAVREHEQYVESEFKASVTNSAEMAARAALDGRWDDQSREAGIGLAAIRTRAAIEGEPADATRIKEREFLSTVHATAINGMLQQGDIDTALEYFDENAGDLSATAEAEIRSRMNPLMLESMADNIESAITTGQPMPSGVDAYGPAAASIRQAENIAVASVGRTINLESGGNPNAKNPRSSAEGAGQFIDSTWYAMLSKHRPDLVAGVPPPGRGRSLPDEIVALKREPLLAKAMAEAYAKENARFLFESGLPVTEETVYMAHRFGPEGASKILRAPPSTPMVQLVSTAAYKANPDLSGKTVAELSASHDRRAGSKPAPARDKPVLVTTGRSNADALRDYADKVPNKLLGKTLKDRADKIELTAERDRRKYERDMTDSVWAKVGQADPNLSPGQILTAEELAFARDNRMLGSIESEQKRKLSGTLLQDNLVLVQTLNEQALDNPTGFSQLVLSKYADQLTPETRARFQEMQAGVNKPETVKDWATDAARVNSIEMALGYDKKKGDQAREAKGALAEAWRLAKEAYIQQNGHPPAREHADRLAQEVKMQFLNNPDKAGQIRSAVTVGASPLDYQRVRDSLRKRYGQEPSEEQIRAILSSLYRNQGALNAD